MEQPQPELERELQTDLRTDDTQKNKTTENNNANCSCTADSINSVDSQKNKGWCNMPDKTDQIFYIEEEQIPNHDMFILVLLA